MLQVGFDGTHFIARLSIDQKETVRRAGFVWDGSIRKWTTVEPKVAYRLFDHCTPQTQAHILDQLDLSISQVPEIKWPSQRKLPFDHQLEGARWVLSRKASALAFEAGTGKTAIAPLCLNSDFGKTMIVCPSFLKLNWEYELEQWLCEFAVVQVFKKLTDEPNPEADIFIVPDSLIGSDKFRKRLYDLRFRFKYIFVDEYHKFKSKSANRTRSLVGGRIDLSKKKPVWLGFQHKTDHFISLSGTPMPNRPIELHYYTSRVAPHAVNFLDEYKFGIRYCDGFESEWGWDFSGASNLDELNHVLTRNFMLVKKLDDCVDLPEKLPSEFIFLEDKRGAVAKKKQMYLLDRLSLATLIRLQTETDPVFKKKVEDMLEDNPTAGALGFISDLRCLLGLQKVDESVKVIKELLETRDKIVVFAWHQEVVQKLCEGLIEFKPLKVTGAVSNQKRHEAVQTFQSSKDHRLFVANIQAAGVGLTLTQSSCVVFVEPSWVPSDNDQAISRCRRIGQTRPVESFFLVVKNSLDHMILNAHQNKNKTIDQVIK